MLAKVAGSNQFKVGTGDKSWSELEYQPNVSGNNGLIYKDGELVVDFSQMPTDKFETLLKQLRLPIWLTKNTNFYVDGTTGSDVLSEGRGLSADKAFKTIQACVNYITSLYNLDSYKIDILLNKGTYLEQLILPNFQNTTGYICIRPYPNISRDEVIIQHTGNTSSLVRIKNGIYYIFDITLKVIENLSIYSGIVFNANLNIEGGSCTIWGIKFIVETTSDAAGSGANLYYRHITVNNGATLNLDDGGISKNNLEFYMPATFQTGMINLFVFYIGGTLTHINFGSTTNPKIIVSGEYRVCMYVGNGFVNFSGLGKRILYESGTPSAKGLRFDCVSNGRIDSNNAGINYFPGTAAGTVESSTYSWYK